MEKEKKCSLNDHKEINAIIFCKNCKIYMCNKCFNLHSGLFKDHYTLNLDKKPEEIFTGLCEEQDHYIKLDYYCKNHNKLCCCACVVKIKKKGNCQHSDCDVCSIEDIQDEKKKILLKNIKILENLTLDIEKSINQLKIINEKINKNKEDIKEKIQKEFTKIRNAINEREDQLLLEIDKYYEKIFFNEDFIRENDKLPNKIKISLEKGKKINNEWNENNLPSLINDCINIENNIKNINLINESIKKFNNFDSLIKFQNKDNELMTLLESIKNFGGITENDDDIQDFKFIFNQGNHYLVTNNGKIATRNDGNNNFKCVIIGNKEIPKNKISKWKFKINSEITHSYIIGIGQNNYNNENEEFYKKCWSFDCNNRKLILKSGLYSDYKNNNKFNEKIKKGDIIEIEINRIKNTLSYIINDINLGIACSDISNNDSLYPIVILYGSNTSIEII